MDFLCLHRTNEWLRDVITEDEKCVLFVIYTRKRQWPRTKETGVPTPKPEVKRFSECVVGNKDFTANKQYNHS